MNPMDLEGLARGKLHDACRHQQREDDRLCRKAVSALAAMLFPGVQSEAAARADFLSKAEVARTGRTTVSVRVEGIRFTGQSADQLNEHWSWKAKPSNRPEGRIASMADLGAILTEQAPPGWPVSS